MSDAPLAERLQVKGARRLAVIAAPEGIDARIGVPPARAPAAEAEVVLLFVADRTALDASLVHWLPRLRPDAILWVAYVKLTSPHATDLNRDVMRHAVQAHGLDTVSQIAVDADWSALRLKRVG